MTVLDGIATQEHLRVSTDGRTRLYGEGGVVLGPLALDRDRAGWTVRDVGDEPSLFLAGCRVAQVPLFRDRPVALHVGAPDGQLVELEVVEVEYAESFLEYGPGATSTLRPVGIRRAEPTPTIESGAGTDAAARAEVAAVVPGTASSGAGSDAGGAPQAPRATGGVLVADRVGVRRGGAKLLDEVSFVLEPGTLTAIIGPSGAGKSTLLRALTGEAPATTGRIAWDGHDLASERDRVRHHVGVVPQEELLHPQLSVAQALTYAAALRLPAGTSAHERRMRVDGVIAQLALEPQRDQRIGTLSGGQRKRVSIAGELLTAPSLLFLDEPTSGLDPGLDRSVMEQLRVLARGGRTVVAVTHSVPGLDACDRVLVLARGGRLVHAGPPAGLLEHFGCADHPELFGLLESGGLPRLEAPAERPALKPPATLEVPDRRGPLAQFATLVRRNLAVVLGDRLTLAMLVVMPLVLGGLGRVVQGDAGLSLVAAKGQGLGTWALATEAGQRLTLLLVAACLMGAAMAVRELVKERALLRREYAVGLSPGAYVAAKAVVLGALCFGQGVAVTWLALAGMPAVDGGGLRGWGNLEVGLVIGLLAAASAMLGLWLSALVRSAEQAMPALVAAVMGQLVLSGALVPVAGRPVLEQLAWLAPARWAHVANAASAHLDRAQPKGAVVDPLTAHAVGRWELDVLWLAVSLVVLLGLTYRTVRRSLR